MSLHVSCVQHGELEVMSRTESPFQRSRPNGNEYRSATLSWAGQAAGDDTTKNWELTRSTARSSLMVSAASRCQLRCYLHSVCLSSQTTFSHVFVYILFTICAVVVCSYRLSSSFTATMSLTPVVCRIHSQTDSRVRSVALETVALRSL